MTIEILQPCHARYHEQATCHYSRWYGRGHLQLAARPGGIRTWPTRSCFRHGLDQILARRLQDGDPGGHMRRGLDRFPFPEMAKRIWDTYYIPGGKAEDQPYYGFADTCQGQSPRADRALHCRQLCRGHSRPRRPSAIRSESTIWKKFRFHICPRFTAPCSPASTTC